MFGVYVHIPFCASRCDYCDFATWTDRAHLADAYVDACVRDVASRYRAGLPHATSVFFGGGTPSLLPADRLVRILDAIPRARGAEVTVECNPDAFDADKASAYRAAGVDRLSFGVQSMRSHVLASLGRTHDPDNVARAVASARAAGFQRLNVDLIYGSPGETRADWVATLDAVLALGPTHVSAYALTVEPATPLGRRVATGEQAPPDDDDQAAKYELADERLGAAGLEWYEVSNWARPGDECRHNLLYWRQGDYLGVGCAAHGHRAGRRWWNVRRPERYVELVSAGRSPEAGHEVLTPGTAAEEALALALRTRDGIKLPGSAADARGMHREAALLGDAGLVTRSGSCLVLTRAGRLLANEVTARLLRARDTEASAPAGAGTRYH